MAHQVLLEEESRLGNWPRRLLHVPTMTSYEWQPGNMYGDFVSPLYNALTYTWGRWKLGDGKRLDVGPLNVEGASWELPRVDPSHFTIDALHAILRSITVDFSFPTSRTS
jgi:hypothetical protein